MNRTDRLLALVLELQAKGWQRAEDLGATFEVSRRTIYRDMLALMESGVPVLSSPGQGFALMEGYFLPPLSFTPAEATVLTLGADVMQQTFDAQYAASARSAATKIIAVMDESRRATVDALRQRMGFVVSNLPISGIKSAMLQQLRRAIIEERQVHMEYYSRHTGEPGGESTSRMIDPYKLIHVEKAWYVNGYCHLRQAVRNFRLDRLDSLTVLNTHFERAAGFNSGPHSPETLPIEVQVLFQPSVARWVQEEGFYYVTHMEMCPEGLQVTLRIRHENDVLAWLLGWGAQVCVLTPDSLRVRLRQEACKLLALYD
jgi:predicted DNA-binding transcriptional regulator YafY